MTLPARRRGTILIVVAGLSALLASLALAFLVHMRSDVEEATELVNEVQAHLMLVAGCNFIQEGSRLGYDTNPPAVTPNTPSSPYVHDEGFGWIDVRDGTLGPQDQNHQPVWATRPQFAWMDLGTGASSRPAFRGPMYVENRPPFAIQQTVARNPISTLVGDPNYGMPLMVNPDPWPVADPTSGTYRSDYITGDTAANPQFYTGSWFRIYRETPATFIVTCGSGETRGWADFRELTGGSRSAMAALSPNDVVYFHNDKNLFDGLKAAEVRLWYRVEWSAAIHSSDYQNVNNNFSNIDQYFWRPLNTLQESQGAGGRSQPHDTNMVGTIRWVQRLTGPPTNW
jgi:hypothetical protein